MRRYIPSFLGLGKILDTICPLWCLTCFMTPLWSRRLTSASIMYSCGRNCETGRLRCVGVTSHSILSPKTLDLSWKMFSYLSSLKLWHEFFRYATNLGTNSSNLPTDFWSIISSDEPARHFSFWAGFGTGAYLKKARCMSVVSTVMTVLSNGLMSTPTILMDFSRF